MPFHGEPCVKRLLRYRLWVLLAVNSVIIFHVVLYYALDRTSIGCIDFFGLATFLGKGQVTAGTLFLGIIILATLFLGRVFCGWGCHFALFQDVLGKLFDRIGVRVPFRRSRMELVVPPILFFVTLFYPIVSWWREHGIPTNATIDLAYPEVWHLLPGLKGVLLILLVDVVALTLLFGRRAFCRLLCPYGLFLKIFHALSPVRVVKVGACSGCGTCARSCPVEVPIKLEIERFGVIRDLNCMNCGDCVAACPDGTLAMKATRLAYTHAFAQGYSPRKQFLWADALLLITTAAGLLLYRGREFGDFLAAGMGLVLGATVVSAIQPQRLALSRVSTRLTKRKVRALAAIVASYLVLGIIGQALGIAFLERGASRLAANDYQRSVHAYSKGIAVAEIVRPFTFYLHDFDDRATSHVSALLARADDLMRASAWKDAELLYRAALEMNNAPIAGHGNLGTALFKQGKYWEAAGCYLVVLGYDPNDLVALYHLAMTRIQLGQYDVAIDIVQKILQIDTEGNAYKLIRENPLFHLLSNDERYRKAMMYYKPRHVARERDAMEARQ